MEQTACGIDFKKASQLRKEERRNLLPESLANIASFPVGKYSSAFICNKCS